MDTEGETTKEIFHSWFTPQMAAVACLGRVKTKGQELLPSFH